MERGDTIHVRHQVLFSVKLLHHYFLDWKAKPYDSQTGDEKLKSLAGYDARSIFGVKPTLETEKLLAGNGLLFKTHGLGFTVTGKGRSDGLGGFEKVPKLAAGTRFRFVLTVKDALFYQYSSPFLTKEQDRIEKAATPEEQDKVFRKVFVLSNLVGNDPDAIAPQLAKPPLVAAQPTDMFPVETIMRLGGNVMQLKQRDTTLGIGQWQLISTARFVTGNDLVEIERTPDLPPDIFGLIEIVQDDAIANADYRLFNPDSSLASPKFEVRIKNRSTWWRYPKVPAVEPTYLPLTARSVTLVDGQERANADARTTLEQERTSDKKHIIRLFSDIYQ